MNDAGQARRERLLGGDALRQLRLRLRRRLEDTAYPTSLRIGNLSEIEHAALAALTGKRASHRRSLLLDVTALDAALQAAGVAASLRDLLERLDGPIVSRTALREHREAGWRAVFEDAAPTPMLAALFGNAAGRSALRRLAAGDLALAARLREDADRILRQLPQSGTARAQLAARTLGDAHALDHRRPVATLVLLALRLHYGVSDDASARELWARAGVLVNELARPALLLNVPVAPSGERWTRPGTPDYVALRELVRRPPPWEVHGVELFVCENPNVVAIAADRLGPRCAPLVCTDGMPAAAQRVLLTQLATCGALVRYHGDFDWPGLHIGNFVLRTFGARPWRFNTADYLAGLDELGDGRTPLSEAATASSWDDELAPTMALHGVGVPEEALMETLLGDLAASHRC